MDPIEELRREVRQLKLQLSEMHRMAKVVAVDVETARLTVRSEGLLQKDVPFFTMRAGEDQTYWLPSVGELGFLMAPCGVSANAIFLPGIFFVDFPAADMNRYVSKRIFRDGTVEEIDTEHSHYKLTVGAEGVTERLADTEQVQDTHDGNTITIDGDATALERPEGSIKIDGMEIEINRSTGVIKLSVGSNMIEMNPFALNLLGALLFPTGITGFQSPVGPVIFSKAASTPGATPVADPATDPDRDGNATKIPEQRIEDVETVAGTLDFILPSITVNVTGMAGPYPIVATAATVSFPVSRAFTTENVTLVLPEKDLE